MSRENSVCSDMTSCISKAEAEASAKQRLSDIKSTHLETKQMSINQSTIYDRQVVNGVYMTLLNGIES